MRRSDLLGNLVRTTLRAVAADAEQDVDPLAHQKVDHHLRFVRTARRAEDRAALVVNVLDHFIGQFDGGPTFGGIEALIAVANAQHAVHAVVEHQFLHEAADDVVDAGAQVRRR